MAKRDRIYVGTVGEGVFRSDDDGHSFTRKSEGMFVECDVRALAVHPQQPSVLFAGTNEGLYRTADYGEHWTRMDSPMNGMVVWSLLVHRNSPDTIFAGTRPANIFRSNDAGRTWKQLDVAIRPDCKNLVFNRVTTLAADPTDPETIWAGIEVAGVRMSRDRGESWITLNDGLSSLDIHGLVVIAGAGTSGRIVATTNNDLNASANAGQSWSPQRFGGKFGRGYFRGITQKRDEPATLLVGNGDGPPGTVGTIWRSIDGGQNWLEAAMPCTANSTIWGFASHGADSERFLAHSVSGEIYETRDAGRVWQKWSREFGEIRALLWVSD